MISVISAAIISCVLCIFLTYFFITFAKTYGLGQSIRDDGPKTHAVKKGTPTMGGIIIIISVVISYFASRIFADFHISPTALVILFLFISFGFIGFLDDWLKIRRANSAGLSPALKLSLQLLFSLIFIILALNLQNGGNALISTKISVLRDIDFDFKSFGIITGLIIFFIWIYIILSGYSNAVNLTDGLDGLASGVGIISFGAYWVLTFWQYNQDCARMVVYNYQSCYNVQNILDIQTLAAATVGALIGFLWHNCSIASVFMGDSGSLSLGALFGAFAIFTQTEILSILIGFIFVISLFSSFLQVVYFKATKGKRIFLMAPIHHHFELKGWAQQKVVIRFWIIAALFAAAALVIFYAEWFFKNGL